MLKFNRSNKVYINIIAFSLFPHPKWIFLIIRIIIGIYISYSGDNGVTTFEIDFQFVESDPFILDTPALLNCNSKFDGQAYFVYTFSV